MAMKLVDGDYVPNVWGGFQQVRGADELIQRIFFKLTARRGALPFMPELGSRLYLLSQEKPAARKGAAEMYVKEALSDETELTLSALEAEEKDGYFEVKMTFDYSGGELSLTVAV